MTTLSRNSSVFTVMVRYTCAPIDQAKLVEVLRPSAQTFAQIPGFVSLAMHQSHEGSHVVVYLQWASKAAHEACFTHPAWATAGQEAMAFIQSGKAEMEVQTFDVIDVIEG